MGIAISEFDGYSLIVENKNAGPKINHLQLRQIRELMFKTK